MSIEALVVKLIDALDRNTAVHSQPVVESEVKYEKPVPFDVPAFDTPAPVVPAPVDTNAIPAFVVPTPAATTSVMFPTAADMMLYVGKKFQTLGNEKGMIIMTVLQEFGTANINGLLPEQYDAFYERLEAATA